MNNSLTKDRARIWWSAFWVGALLLPPIPIGLTGTRSSFSVSLFVCAAYLLVRILRRPIFLPNPRRADGLLFFSIAGYFVFHTAFYALQGEGGTALMELQWIVYFCVGYMLTQELTSNGREVTPLYKIMLAVLLVEAVLGIISAFYGPIYSYAVPGYHNPRFFAGIYRATGTTKGTNLFGSFMAFGAVLSMWLPREQLPVKRWLALSLLLAAVVVSQSKAAYAAVFMAFEVGFILSMIRMVTQGGFSFVKLLSMILVVVIMAVGGLFVISRMEVMELVMDDMLLRVQFTQRVQDMFTTADVFTKFIGVGFRNSAVISPFTQAWVTAHNSYVSMLVEIGIAGLSLLVVLFARTLYMFWLSREAAWFTAMAVMLAIAYSECFLYDYIHSFLLGAVIPLSGYCVMRYRKDKYAGNN